MADSSKIDGTPKSKTIKRLGIRRIVPSSAPRPILTVSITPNTNTNKSNQKLNEKHSRLGSYSVPTKKITVNKTADVIDSKDSTPILRTKKKLSDGIERKCRVVVKKLNLTELPTVESSSPTKELSDEATGNQSESLVDKIIQLQRDNDVLKSNIVALQNHESDVNQLKATISKWNVGAKEALELLKSKLQPTQSATTILNHYGIPLEIFNEIIMEDE